MNYTRWANSYLTQHYFSYKKKRVSVWCTKDETKPLAVLVHGINGNYAGLVPLAVELSRHYQVAIVELPGHGLSDVIPIHKSTVLQAWFTGVLAEIETNFRRPSLIIAHSFGCAAILDIKVLANYKVVLLNPVPVPSDMYRRYARMIVRSAYFWAHIYNWRVFILLRSVVLRKINTHEAKKRIRWAGWSAQPSYEQIVYQAGLVDIILDKKAYGNAHSGNVALVVCGLQDTTATQRDTLDMQAVFGATPTVFINGGHLLPIEVPGQVAHAINRFVVH